MVSLNVREEILNQLGQLSSEHQRLVLEYAQKLAISEVKGVPGKNLLRFSGTFSEADADAISRIIESNCERVDVDEW
jgi:hypothetical protein